MKLLAGYILAALLLSLTNLNAALAQENAPAQNIHDTYVVHFILDGTNLRSFESILDSGALPNISQYMVGEGAYFTHAMSSFPTVSTSVYQSFSSGLYPGRAGISHLERFDRLTRHKIDYLSAEGHDAINTDFVNLRALKNPDEADPFPPSTIFDMLKGYPTAAFYTSFRLGASTVFPEILPLRALWHAFITRDRPGLDALALNKIEEAFSGEIDKIPRYTIAGLYGSDVAAHELTPTGDEVKLVLMQFDAFLGDFIKLLKARGLFEKTYLIVSADHGMHETRELFELQKKVSALGVAVKPENPRARGFSLHIADRGVVSSQLYSAAGTSKKPIAISEVLRHHPLKDGGEIDLIEAIIGFDEVAQLAVRDGEGNTRIFGQNSAESMISCNTINASDYCSYSIIGNNGDPLEYAKNPEVLKLMDGRAHSSNIWLAATKDEKYPDAIIQLSQLFDDGRAGDAFVILKDEYSLRHKKRGNHGGIIADDMRIPMIISGPTVPNGRFDLMRSIDTFPLLIEWFGIKTDEANYDGQNPFIRRSTDHVAEALSTLDQLFMREPQLAKIVDTESFADKKAYPLIRGVSPHQVMMAARAEGAYRARTAKKLDAILKDLKEQRAGKDGRIQLDRKLIADRIDIIESQFSNLLAGSQRMDDIVALLNGRRHVNWAGEYNE